jgi:hypothetical protein
MRVDFILLISIVLISFVHCCASSKKIKESAVVVIEEDENRTCANNHSTIMATSATAGTSSITKTVSEKYTQDGVEAQAIAKYLPYFPFKGIPRFYDIGGFLYEPHVFQKIVDIFADRYREIGIDVVAGYDTLRQFRSPLILCVVLPCKRSCSDQYFFCFICCESSPTYLINENIVWMHAVLCSVHPSPWP